MLDLIFRIYCIVDPVLESLTWCTMLCNSRRFQLGSSSLLCGRVLSVGPKKAGCEIEGHAWHNQIKDTHCNLCDSHPDSFAANHESRRQPDTLWKVWDHRRIVAGARPYLSFSMGGLVSLDTLALHIYCARHPQLILIDLQTSLNCVCARLHAGRRHQPFKLVPYVRQ